jgi:hypothetical protein
MNPGTVFISPFTFTNVSGSFQMRIYVVVQNKKNSDTYRGYVSTFSLLDRCRLSQSRWSTEALEGQRVIWKP